MSTLCQSTNRGRATVVRRAAPDHTFLSERKSMARGVYPRKPKPIADRFWPKVDKSAGPDACWTWTASRAKNGYGKFGIGGHDGGWIGAHCAAWLITRGEIPCGSCVCHSCDNPICVNPSHLWIGTHKDNARDKSMKGRAVWKQSHGMRKNPLLMSHGTRRYNAKLNDDIVRKIRNATGSHKDIGIRFGVCRTVVGKVRRREIWKHVA